MRWKPVAIAVGVLAVVAGAFVLQHIPQRFFPFAERDQFVVDVWLPEGWKVEATEAAVRRIEDVLQHEKEVVNYTSFIGSSSPRFYYNVNPQLPDKNYAQLLVSTDVGGSHAEAGRGAAPADWRRRRRKPASSSANCSRVRSRKRAIEIRLTGEDENVLAVLGRSGSAAAASARLDRWTCTATGARMPIA